MRGREGRYGIKASAVKTKEECFLLGRRLGHKDIKGRFHKR